MIAHPTSVSDVILTHGHMFSGSGFGALGMQEAHARVGMFAARMECLGGIDADPVACEDFTRLLGVPASCLDLFDEEQFIDWHAACVGRSRRCRTCFNTGRPPHGWRAAQPHDVRAAFQNRHPNIMFQSSPCKGLSGLQTPTRAESRQYQALNRLTLRGMQLMLEAFADDPPELVIFENVPLIATRGRDLLDEIRDLLFLHGYAVAETFHDCGELGGLAQRRRRFLLVARHRAKVPPFLYEPPKHRLKGVGEVIGGLPLPDAPGAGPMHRCPRLTWDTWVRLALIPAGGDWRSLEDLDYARLAIQPLPDDYAQAGVLGVTRWTDPAATLSGRSGPTNGAYSVSDPRLQPAHHGSYGVQSWSEPAATITSSASPSTGVHTVGDPRPLGVRSGGRRHNDVFRVVDWTSQAGAITSGTGPSSGGQSVSDPRTSDHGTYQAYRVLHFDEPSPAVTSQSAPGGGGYTVADPRPGTGYESQQSAKWEVTPYDEPTRTVIAANGTGQGAAAVQDPRLGSYGRHGGKLRVESWTEASHTITTSDRVGSGALSIADPRPLPAPLDRPDPVPVIFALDGTWHRPFTTLELAALQFGEDFARTLMDRPLATPRPGKASHTTWREHIGNAVPRASSRAIGSEMARTLLMVRTGQTFRLSSTPIWVQPLAAALALEPR